MSALPRLATDLLTAAMFIGLAGPAAAQGNNQGQRGGNPRDTSVTVTQRALPGMWSVMVTPDGEPASYPKNSGPHTLYFGVVNTGELTDTYTFTCSSLGGISCVSVNPTSKTLPPDMDWDVAVTFNVGSSGGTLKLRASGNATDYGSYTITATLPAPIVDVSPINYDHQDMNRCAAGCFAATFAHSTVPYYSLDMPRNVTLVYHGDRVDPRPFVHVNVSHPSGQTPTPQQYWLQVKKGGVLQQFVNGETTLHFTASSTVTQRLGGQLDASSWGDGVFDIDVIVTSDYGATGTNSTTVQTKLAVVNEADSPIARGWTIAGIQRLYVQGDGSALITDGTGSLVYFRKVGSEFTTPAGEFSQLATITGGYQRRYPDSSYVQFNTSGRMTYACDQYDSCTMISYDGSYRVTYIYDPLYKSLHLSYGTYGLSSIRGAATPYRYTYFTVAANGRLLAICDPDGDSTSLGYDGSLRLSSITDRRGYTTDLTYHSASGRTSNKVVSTATPSVQLYTGGSQRPTVTYAPWQLVGVPYGTTASSPAAVVKADTVYGRVTDAGSHVTRFTVDRWGQPVALTDPDPLNATTTVTYNSNGLPIRSVISVDPGAVDTAAYNANGVPTYARPAGGTATTISYHATWVTQPTTVTTSGLPTQTFWIGTNGRVDSTMTGSAYKQRYTYDGYGRALTVTDALGTVVSRAWYDGTNGNRSKDSVPGGRVTTYGYDTYGRNTTVTPPGMPTRTTYYDVLNRPDSIRDGVNSVATRFTYDDASNVVSVRDPKSQIYGFAYNALGWVYARTDPAGVADTLKYDVEGQLREWRNRRRQVTRYSYDALHRPTGKGGADTDSTAFTYSSNRRQITAQSRAGGWGVIATDNVYLSVLGVVDSATTTFGNTPGFTRARHYRYSAAGVLDSVWVAPFSNNTFLGRKYFYNTARGTVDSVRIGGKTRSSRFDANLRDTLTVVASGDSTFHEYLQGGQQSGLVMSSPTVESFNRYLGYDQTGRIHLQFTDSTPEPFSSTFGYDGLGRVVADTGGVVDVVTCTHDDARGWQCGYDIVEDRRRLAYDAVGNVTRDSLWDYQGLVSVDVGTYGTGNRISAFGACNYTTDADGNVTSRICGADSLNLYWSSDNRLDSLRSTGVFGRLIRFFYDGFGRLVKRDPLQLADAYFWWDGDRIYADLNNAGLKEVEYLYAGMDNPRVIATDDSTVYFAARDGLGNVIGLESHSGGHQAQYDYDLWGNVSGWEYLSPSGTINRARFKGALWMGEEGPDLYYMRARWYEPRTGRFLSEDPIGLRGGINSYSFARGDAVNASDPTGLEPCGEHEAGHWDIGPAYWDNDRGAVVGTWVYHLCMLIDGGDNDHEYAFEDSYPSWSGGTGSGSRTNAATSKQESDDVWCALGLDVAVRGAADFALLYLYSTGAGLAVRGGALWAEGWMMSRGVILTATVEGLGATGAMEMLVGGALARAGASTLIGTAVAMPQHGGWSFVPLNTYNYLSGGRPDCR